MARAIGIGLALGFGLFVTGCGWGEVDDSAPLTILDNFRVIESGKAYRSAQIDATTLRLVVNEFGIRTVVNLRGENDDMVWYRNERTTTQQLGIKQVDIAMSAQRLPSRENLLLLWDTFQTADYPILIHCQAGADRTGAAAAIWRMEVQGAPREAAALELSPLYGHFRSATPAMDELVAIFQPDRQWIESGYSPP